jgi:hypothetical protein
MYSKCKGEGACSLRRDAAPFYSTSIGRRYSSFLQHKKSARASGSDGFATQRRSSSGGKDTPNPYRLAQDVHRMRPARQGARRVT